MPTELHEPDFQIAMDFVAQCQLFTSEPARAFGVLAMAIGMVFGSAEINYDDNAHAQMKMLVDTTVDCIKRTRPNKFLP